MFVLNEKTPPNQLYLFLADFFIGVAVDGGDVHSFILRVVVFGRQLFPRWMKSPAMTAPRREKHHEMIS